MIASRCGRRRRGAPEDRTLGCVLRPKGLATVWGALGAPGPTHTRARGTKNEPTSGPAPRSTIDPFHPARVGLGPVGNSYYVANVRSYNETFGVLGMVLLLLTWFYLTAFSVLLGAELNAELERQTVRDTTEGPARPLGQRGAAAADTVMRSEEADKGG